MFCTIQCFGVYYQSTTVNLGMSYTIVLSLPFVCQCGKRNEYYTIFEEYSELNLIAKMTMCEFQYRYPVWTMVNWSCVQQGDGSIN